MSEQSSIPPAPNAPQPVVPENVATEREVLRRLRETRLATESGSAPDTPPTSDTPVAEAGDSSPDTAPAAPSAAESAPSAEAESASDATPSASGADDTAEVETVEAQTLGDLATILDLEDASPLYNLSVSMTTPDGPVSQTIGEWQDKAQDLVYATKARQEAERAREMLAEQRQQLEAQYKEQIAQAASMLEAVKKQALAEFQDVDWKRLGEEDPAQYAMQRQRYNDQMAAIESNQRGLAASWQQHMQQQDAVAADARKAYLEGEQAALIKALPEWADAETARTGGREVAEFLQQNGFTAQETGSIADHRVVLIARMAMEYAKHMKSVEPVKKRVLAMPKSKGKPSARGSGQRSNAQKIADLSMKASKAPTRAAREAIALEVMKLRRQ